MKRFSKLKKQIESLFEPSLNMEFCCYAYPIYGKNSFGKNSIPRFCIKLEGEVIWDYPKDFRVKDIHYGYWANDNGICELVKEYIDAPIKGLLDRKFNETKEYEGLEIEYNLTDIFKAADRRFGRERLIEWTLDKYNKAAVKILIRRVPIPGRTFRENGILGKKLLEFQGPVTYESARAQVFYIESAKHRNTNEYGISITQLADYYEVDENVLTNWLKTVPYLNYGSGNLISLGQLRKICNHLGVPLIYSRYGDVGRGKLTPFLKEVKKYTE